MTNAVPPAEVEITTKEEGVGTIRVEEEEEEDTEAIAIIISTTITSSSTSLSSKGMGTTTRPIPTLAGTVQAHTTWVMAMEVDMETQLVHQEWITMACSSNSISSSSSSNNKVQVVDTEDSPIRKMITPRRQLYLTKELQLASRVDSSSSSSHSNPNFTSSLLAYRAPALIRPLAAPELLVDGLGLGSRIGVEIGSR